MSKDVQPSFDHLLEDPGDGIDLLEFLENEATTSLISFLPDAPTTLVSAASTSNMATNGRQEAQGLISFLPDTPTAPVSALSTSNMAVGRRQEDNGMITFLPDIPTTCINAPCASTITVDARQQERNVNGQGTSATVIDMRQEADPNVMFENIKSEYLKDQKKATKADKLRGDGKNKQLVIDGEVIFSVRTRKQYANFQISAYVRRTFNAAESMKNTECFHDPAILDVELLKVESNSDQTATLKYQVDLGRAYYTPRGNIVFDLSTFETGKRNMFEIVVSIVIPGECEEIYNSRPFLVKSKKTLKRKSEQEKSPTSRSRYFRLETDDSRLSWTDSPTGQIWENPNLGTCEDEGYSPVSTPSSSRCSSPKSTLVFDKVHVQSLDVEKAFIKDLHLLRKITTSQGDTGYKFPIPEGTKKEDWPEGTVVGLLEGDDGKTHIEVLSSENAQKVKLAGVISQSAYIESTKVTDAKDSDVVCVMGVVNVNIVGGINNGEPVYAHSRIPGVGISRSNWHLLSQQEDEVPIFIAQALECKHSENCSSVHLVRCFVSLLLGIQSRHTMELIHDEKQRSRVILDTKMKTQKRKILKAVASGITASVIFLILLGVMLREFTARSSSFQYYLCSKGKLSKPPACIIFSSPLDGEKIKVKGYEFQWRKLKHKLALDLNSIEEEGMANGTVHYYLNLDRCAYVRPWFRNKKESRVVVIKGVEIFAVEKGTNNENMKIFHIDLDEDGDEQWNTLKMTVKFKGKCTGYKDKRNG